jgi:hypothetical protein
MPMCADHADAVVPPIPLHGLRRGADRGPARRVPARHDGYAAIPLALALWLVVGEPVREGTRSRGTLPCSDQRGSRAIV